MTAEQHAHRAAELLRLTPGIRPPTPHDVAQAQAHALTAIAVALAGLAERGPS